MVKSIAHRGASNLAPENSLEAFSKALSLNADMIEFDVRCTKDGVLVIMHDNDVGRATDGEGSLRRLPFEVIRNFRLPNGKTVPTLQEVLRLLKGRCVAKIDLKESGVEEQTLHSIRSNGMIRQTIVAAESPKVLLRLKSLCPSIRTEAGGFKQRKWRKVMITHALRAQADIIAPHHTLVSRRLVEECHRNGLEVHTWTVNTTSDIERVKRCGVDGITTDYLERL